MSGCIYAVPEQHLFDGGVDDRVELVRLGHLASTAHRWRADRGYRGEPTLCQGP